MKKILIINTVEFEYNGITKVILNILENVDINEYNIDIVACDKIDASIKEGVMTKINKFYDFGFRKKSLFKYMLNLQKIIKENRYDVIHIHGNSSTMAFESLVAKMCNTKKIIAHNHNNQTGHPYINQLLKPLLKLTITDALSCSEIAGKWLFGKYKFNIYKNGIDTERYKIKFDVRETIRRELGINNELIIGHIGLFNEQKNQIFLLEVIKKLVNMGINAKLLLIGHGDKKNEFIESASRYGVLNDIVILENRSDICDLLMGMDIFAFPSKWEGFGIALLEAQASGLECIASTGVSQEVNISGKVRYSSLENIEEWVCFCENSDVSNRKNKSNENINKIVKNGYDSKDNVVKMLEEYYQ